MATGRRVRNAYATNLKQGDSPAKVGVISHSSFSPHEEEDKPARGFKTGMRDIRQLER